MIHPTRSLAIVLTLVLSGCATIVSGPTQQVHVDSNPQGARVFTGVESSRGAVLKRREVGVTPLAVTITRKDGVVILEKDGYVPTRVPLQRGVNPWIIGDVLMTSLLSTSIDTSTGAANQYDPDSYLVELAVDEMAAQVPAAEPASTPAAEGAAPAAEAPPPATR